MSLLPPDAVANAHCNGVHRAGGSRCRLARQVLMSHLRQVPFQAFPSGPLHPAVHGALIRLAHPGTAGMDVATGLHLT